MNGILRVRRQGSNWHKASDFLFIRDFCDTTGGELKVFSRRCTTFNELSKFMHLIFFLINMNFKFHTIYWSDEVFVSKPLESQQSRCGNIQTLGGAPHLAREVSHYVFFSKCTRSDFDALSRQKVKTTTHTLFILWSPILKINAWFTRSAALQNVKLITHDASTSSLVHDNTQW